jgi:hypothetical protein
MYNTVRLIVHATLCYKEYLSLKLNEQMSVPRALNENTLRQLPRHKKRFPLTKQTSGRLPGYQTKTKTFKLSKTIVPLWAMGYHGVSGS